MKQISENKISENKISENLKILKNLQESYRQKVDTINMDLKKKFFIQLFNNHVSNNISNSMSSIKITSYDDMYKELYFKHKYFNDIFLLNNISLEYQNSGNIVKDILYLLSKFDIKYVQDNKFKVCKFNKFNKFNNELNYFNPKSEDEIILYNSTDLNTFQQSEFRKQINNINMIINNYYSKIYTNNRIEMIFYEDTKYDMNWIIVSINKVNYS